MSSSQQCYCHLNTIYHHFQFAIKNIDISDHKRKDQLLTEVIVMRDLNHPNLVNYVELFLERDNLMMVMEFMQVKLRDNSNPAVTVRGHCLCRAEHLLMLFSTPSSPSLR